MYKKLDSETPSRFLKTVFEPEIPLAKLYESESFFYLYDTGTNKILECRREVYLLLSDLMGAADVETAVRNFIERFGEEELCRAADEIKEAVEQEHILKVQRIESFGLADHFKKDIGKMLASSVQSMTLEVTQDCNLRCVYCIYNDFVARSRNHERKSMSLETARQAIRILESRSRETKKVALGFYGGEPMLQFPMIKQLVEYTKALFGKRELLFHCTTNATLITHEMAEFLMKNDFSVLVSFDGPERYHDAFRKDRSGDGSFDKTLEGLKILIDKQRAIKKGSVSLNIVYTPPFGQAKLDELFQYFKDQEWLSDIDITTSYPSSRTIPVPNIEAVDVNEDKDLLQWAFENYRESFGDSAPMVRGVIEKQLARIMKRPVFKHPTNQCLLNGCCVPGHRKSYVSADGTIQMCEKMTDFAPPLGHVNQDFDVESIKKHYIEDYARESLNDCSRCWAVRMCELCYILAFNDEGTFDLQKKRDNCRSRVNSQERILEYFSTLMEQHPEKLQYLYKYDLS